jgi:hypothetical protein
MANASIPAKSPKLPANNDKQGKPSFIIAQAFRKRQVNMNSLIQQVRHFSPTGNKVAITLIFSLAAGIFSVSPAFADRGGNHGLGIHHHYDYGHRDLFNDYEYRHGYGYGPGYGRQPAYRQPYIYAQPIYVPPPIYYPPPQSPGINLFFPLDMRHR